MKWFDLVWRLVEVALGQWVQDLTQDLARWRWRMFQSLLMVMLASLCGLAVLLLVAVLVVLAYWDTHRLEALSALVLVYTVLAAWMVRRAGRMMILPLASSTSWQDGRVTCAVCGSKSGRPCRGG
jgi:uncharacterized membrane protein YqjE